MRHRVCMYIISLIGMIDVVKIYKNTREYHRMVRTATVIIKKMNVDGCKGLALRKKKTKKNKK